VLIKKKCKGSGGTAPHRADVNICSAWCKILCGARTQTQPRRR